MRYLLVLAAIAALSIDVAEAGPLRNRLGPQRRAQPERRAPAVARAGVEGSNVHAGVEVDCDLPRSERLKNTGGRDGKGLCVFTSIERSGRWSNVEELIGFQQKMKSELGGGHPEKVDRMMARYAPGVPYLQFEGRDPRVLIEALKSGRMPCVTYDGRDPHYGRSIAHMVNIVSWDEEADLVCVSDNNYCGDDQFIWHTQKDFVDRWLGGGIGWCVILLAPPPPPPPIN